MTTQSQLEKSLLKMVLADLKRAVTTLEALEEITTSNVRKLRPCRKQLWATLEDLENLGQ